MSYAKSIPNLAKINFLCSGIGALIGWNSVLTALDFFETKFPYNVAFLFAIPLFVSTNIFSYLIYIVARYITLNARIVGGLLLMAVILILMPIVAVILPNDNGFYIVLILIFFLGMSNAIMQGSAVSFAAMFPSDCMSYYFTGTGIAGITICFLRMIVLLIFGSEDYDGIIIGTIAYFTLSASFLMFNLILHLKFMKTDFCKHFLRLAMGSVHKEGSIEMNSNGKEINEKEVLLMKDSREHKMNVNKIEVFHKFDHNWAFIWKVFKKIMPMPFLVWLIYVQTFMMFPGVSLKKEINGISVAWSSTLLILTFNIMDTVGKYLSAIKSLYSKNITILLVMLRFIFFIFYLIMATRDDVYIISNDVFAFFNMALFALSNGFTTSCCMVLAPDLAENNEKETTGFLMTHPLYFGIMCGSFLALPFEKI